MSRSSVGALQTPVRDLVHRLGVRVLRMVPHPESRRLPRGTLSLSVCIFLAFALIPAVSSAAEKYVYKESFDGNGALHNPIGLAYDQTSGDVYTTDTNSSLVDKFDPTTGELVTGFGTGGQINGSTTPAGSFSVPWGLAIDQTNGDFYVSDYGHGMVDKFDSSGSLIPSFGDGGEINGSTTPQGSLSALTIAVNPATQELYVANLSSSVIDVYNANGEYQRQFSTDQAGSPVGVTVDTAGYVYVAGGGLVEKFNPSGTPASGNPVIDSSGSTVGVAVDTSNNDIYVANGSNIEYFDSSGSLLGTFTTASMQNTLAVGIDPVTHLAYAADDSSSVVNVFKEIPLPGVRINSPTQETPTSVTLNGQVDPVEGENITACRFEYGTNTSYSLGSVPCAQPTPFTTSTEVSANLKGLTTEATYHYRLNVTEAQGGSESPDQTFTPGYVAGLRTGPATDVTSGTVTLNGSFVGNSEETHYYFQWGTTLAYRHETMKESAGSPSGPGPTALSVGLGSLNPATTYHYRIVALNELGTTYGEDRTVTTALAAPSIIDESVGGVQSDLAVLHAEVNPGGSATTYHFEYGDTNCSSNSCTSLPDVELGSGITYQGVGAHLSALASGTVYHYRVVAENAIETTYGPDQTFTTYPFLSVSDLCANAHVRQQTGAALLPDCRAYELVSASNTGGYDVESDLTEGQAPYAGYPEAENPSEPKASARVLYAVHDGGIPGTNNPTNRGPDPYIATRGENGWSTEYVGVPASNPFSAAPFTSIPSGANSSLETFAFGAPGGCSPCFEHGYTGIPVRYEGKLVQGMAGSLDPGPSAKPAGRIAKDLSADGTHFVFGSKSKFEPDGNEGEISIYDHNLSTGETHVVSKTPGGETMEEEGQEIAELDISADGSHILIGKLSGEAEGQKLYHLYMNVGDSDRTIDLTPGAAQGVRFDGMTSDGTKVFFSSEEHLTGEDTHHTGADIYIWEEGQPLTLVSTGTEGDASSCDPPANTLHEHWNTTGAQNCGDVAIGGGGGVASGDGTIYFLSPSLLDGTEEPTDGVKNAPNLYVVSPGQSPRFVATLESSLTGPHPPLVSHSLLSTFGHLSEPKFIAVDNSGGPSTGDVYVADTTTSTIYKYDSSHNLIVSWGEDGKLADLGAITGIAVNTSGELIVSGGGLFRYAQDGTLVYHGSSGLAAPDGIAVDAAGNIYGGVPFSNEVPEYSEEFITEVNVTKFSSSGEDLGPLTSGFFATGFAVDPSNGDLYVDNGSEPAVVDHGGGNSIYRFSFNGSGEVVGREVFATGLSENGSIAVNSDHDVFVDEGNKVSEFGPSGNRIAAPIGSSLLGHSSGIALDSAGDIFAANVARGDVDMFGPSEPYADPAIDNPTVVDSVGSAEARHTGDFQVTPNGEFAVFTSTLPLTGVESAGHEEIYRYDDATESLSCASCDPTGVDPTGDSELAADGLSLTNDGRVFFTSAEPLVERDADSRRDVYEWEARGMGPEAAACREASFTFSVVSGGCLGLISTGTSSFDSRLLGVSANGIDAYFFTRDKLVPQDENGYFVKIYDARELGGFEYTPPKVPCKASDECHGPSSPTPPPPNIHVNTGTSGNEIQAATKGCRAGFVEKRGRCVKKHPKHKHHKRAPRQHHGGRK